MKFRISRTSVQNIVYGQCYEQPCDEAAQENDGLWYIDFPDADAVLEFIKKYEPCLMFYTWGIYDDYQPHIDINDDHY